MVALLAAGFLTVPWGKAWGVPGTSLWEVLWLRVPLGMGKEATGTQTAPSLWEAN